MTRKEQRQYWLKFHRFQQRYEKQYAPKINAVLKQQVKTYIQRRDTIYVRSGEMAALLLTLHQTTGTAWAWHNRSFKAGGLGFSERMFQLIRQYFFADIFRIAEDITQTTIRLIQEILTKGAQTGASFDDMVKEMEAADFTVNRSRLIARTETVGAANAAYLLNAKESKIPMNKIWIAAKDDRTRLHHREVDGTVVPLHSKFTVGGTQMDAPGDKEGGASECCNCRCVLGGVPI